MGCRPNFLKTMKAINRLSSEIHEKGLQQDKPYGGGNPYYYCPSCERSNVEYSVKGHYTGCEKDKLDKEYKALVSKYESQFNYFMQSREFESTSFRNYLWFVNYSFPFYKMEEYVRKLAYENKRMNEKIHKENPENKEELSEAVFRNKELTDSINMFLKSNRIHY